MALRRTKTRTAGKQWTCSRCGDTIAKGDTYVSWEMGFRPSRKIVRCSKGACFPRASERETSMVADAYAAQENAEDEINGLAAPNPEQWEQAKEDLQGVVTTAGEAVAEVGEQYREADEAFGGQGTTEHAERADTLEAAADELQGWDLSSEPDTCGEGHDSPMDDCDSCIEEVSTWWDAAKAEAIEALGQVELP